MPRIAIIGSCITRDLWPIRGDMDDLLYVSRTSFPSLFARPVRGFRARAKPPEGLTRHQHRAVVADLEKTALAALLAFRPTHVIFDFIDERFDLISAGDALATHSWELEVSGYLEEPPFAGRRSIPRLSAACERLWREAAGEFAALVRATALGDAALILHSARWANRRRDRRGRERPLPTTEILPGRAEDIEAHNRLLAAYEAEFLGVMPTVTLLAAPDDRLADDRHQWGLSPFHYVPSYYEEIWRQLEPLGIERPPVTGRGGGPNARAA